ncbi:MAG: universal stress protein [Solirubrobacteraceae bacterium]
MYTTVLVGVDGSDVDRDVVAVAHHLVRNYDRLILADLGAGLHDIAEREGVDLLIVGRCHRSPAGRALLGDNTRSALHRAPCTIAVVPTGYAERAHVPTRIGVAYDGSVQSQLALQHAATMAERHGATVAAKDVVQFPLYAEAGAWSLVNSTGAQLADVRASLGDVGEVDVSVAVGVTRNVLQAFSETVDALFCGSRRYSTVRRVALGSTSDYLARHAACPLFVTPAHAEARIDGRKHEAPIAV